MISEEDDEDVTEASEALEVSCISLETSEADHETSPPEAASCACEFLSISISVHCSPVGNDGADPFPDLIAGKCCTLYPLFSAIVVTNRGYFHCSFVILNGFTTT